MKKRNKKNSNPAAQSWFSVRNEAVDTVAQVSIHDEIGLWGVTHRDFAAALAQIPKDKEVLCTINSLGGDLYQGIALYSTIKARGNVTTKVLGIAASSATLPYLAGSKRVMGKNSFLMIHNPTGSIYEADDKALEGYAEALKKMRGQMISLYADNSDLDPKEIEELMDAATWFTSEEAEDNGMCDEVTDEEMAVTAKLNLHGLPNVPEALAERAAAGSNQAPPTSKNIGAPIMQKLLIALAEAKLITSATLNEDQATAEVRTAIARMNTESETLKTENNNHRAALKARIETRVQAAIDRKLIKAERKDSLVTLGLQAEANLDFLDDIAANAANGQTSASSNAGNTDAAGNTGRERGAVSASRVQGNAGHPPLPSGTNGGDDQDPEARLGGIYAQMRTERDPAKLADLTMQARQIRGHKEFEPVQFRPARN